MTFDTSKARAAIFQRIRASQRRGGAGQADIDDYLQRHPAGPRPQQLGDLKERFVQMAERMASTVDQVADETAVPEAVVRYVISQGLAAKAVIWPTLAALPWSAAGIDVEARAPSRGIPGDAIGITGCYCALAETGTLVLLSSDQTPASTHLLPETHIAVVPAARIVADMEQAFALLRSERGGVDAMMPRAINMVSGPSRTGDIEQTIVLGAHGPYRVHIIVHG